MYSNQNRRERKRGDRLKNWLVKIGKIQPLKMSIIKAYVDIYVELFCKNYVFVDLPSFCTEDIANVTTV